MVRTLGRCLLNNGSLELQSLSLPLKTLGVRFFQRSHLAFKIPSKFNDTQNDPFELKMWSLDIHSLRGLSVCLKRMEVVYAWFEDCIFTNLMN